MKAAIPVLGRASHMLPAAVYCNLLVVRVSAAAAEIVVAEVVVVVLVVAVVVAVKVVVVVQRTGRVSSGGL